VARCTAFATNLFHQGQRLLTEHKGRKKMGEEPVLELLEAICNEGEKEGEWLNALDVVGTKGKLTVKEQHHPDTDDTLFQACSGSECQALVRVCDGVRTEAGESDIAEMIYRGHYMSSAAKFAERICTKMTDACVETVDLKDPRVDEPFNAMDSKKWEAKKMSKMMKGMGMGGQLYDRESMADMLEDEGMGGLGGMGGMGDMGDMGMPPEAMEDMPDAYSQPPPPPTSYASGDSSKAPAFPLADTFEAVHKKVMGGIDAAMEAAEPLVKTVEGFTLQAVEGLRDVVASVSGKAKEL
jgi:hypothetical protein